MPCHCSCNTQCTASRPLSKGHCKGAAPKAAQFPVLGGRTGRQQGTQYYVHTLPAPEPCHVQHPQLALYMRQMDIKVGQHMRSKTVCHSAMRLASHARIGAPSSPPQAFRTPPTSNPKCICTDCKLQPMVATQEITSIPACIYTAPSAMPTMRPNAQHKKEILFEASSMHRQV